MRRIIPEEDLNLQDLIFILLFFFIIAQTLIIFKVQKDMIIPPKVDKEPELIIEKSKQFISVIIDEGSNVFALVDNREDVIEGFTSIDPEEIKAYCDPFEGADLFLDSESEIAYKDLIAKIKEIKARTGYDMPRIGLIADHRARYGTVFQVNLAIQELIVEEEIDSSVKWKVYIKKKDKGTLAEEALKSMP